MKTAKNHFINGEWKEGHGNTFSSINPADKLTVWEGRGASIEDVKEAIDSARIAINAWGFLALENRYQYLEAFKKALVHSEEAIAEAISKETGKPLWESVLEVKSMIAKIPLSLQAYEERCHPITFEKGHTKSFTRFKPHGVIAVLGPYNFPGHLPNGHIVPALLAGNTVVFKPSELTPFTAELIAECWRQANLPPGVFNLVQGGRDTGGYLTQAREIDGIYFTGSWETGHQFLQQFASQPEKILALEMGGNNPLVVTNIKDIQAACVLTVLSAYLTSGQRCSCARRLIIPNGQIGDEFLEALINYIPTLALGPYHEKPEPFMGPLITAHAATKVLSQVESLEKLGGKHLIKPKLQGQSSAMLSPGLMDVTSIKLKPDIEIFGPFLQVIRVQDFEKAIQEAGRTAYGLTAGLLSDDPREFETFYKNIKAGVINWNTALTGASSQAPFGGLGISGNHRPSGFFAADYCTFPVASMQSSSLQLPDNIPIALKR